MTKRSKSQTEQNRINWARSFAASNKGRLKTKDIPKDKAIISLECRKKHKWKIEYNSFIRQKSWCPICSCRFKAQEKLLRVLKTVYKNCEFRVNYRNLNFLKNPLTGKNLEIDIFIVDRKNKKNVAIEYDGEHHFMPIEAFGGKKRFQKQLLLDSLKNELMKNNKDKVQYFIRFSYKDKLDKSTVISRLLEHKAI